VIDARVGEIRLRGTNQNDVVVDLELEAKERFWFFSDGDPQAVDLQSEIRNGELRLTLRGDREDLTEHWEIAVPSRLAARVNLNVGEIRVDGVAGGLDASVDVGSINIDVPEGSVRARADVGEVEVDTATSSYSEIDLRSDIGETDAVLNGRRIRPNRTSFTGSRTTASGSGKDRFDLRANIGSAKLTIR
jgi:hypothetical protein